MSARLGPPRAVVGGARGLAQRFLARLAFGRQALLSPGVMRPCRVASDGQFFSSVGGFSLSSFLLRTDFAFVSLGLLCVLGSSHAASSHAATLEQSAVFFTQRRLRVSGFLFGSAGFSGICWKATRAPGHLSARAPRAAVCYLNKRFQNKNL